jgi:hypothetical protein
MKESGAMERHEFIRKNEEVIHLLEQDMQRAVERKDSKALARLAQGWRLANENWLLAARGMSPEKANTVMVGFALGELSKWMEERRPGPPPSVLTLYDGPISDEDFGKAQKGNRKE